MRRLFVSGGSGLLGNALVRMATRDWDVSYNYLRHEWHYPGTHAVQLDISDREVVLNTLLQLRPEIIIHTAGIRSMDYCEDHQQDAQAVNVDGTRHLAEAAKALDIPLFYVSTDSVFDGERGWYTEQDTPRPLNAYGRTKWEAEQAIRKVLPENQFLIARTSTIHGRSLFAKSLVEWILGELQQHKTLDMIVDSYFSPISNENLSAALLEFASNGAHGLFHVAGSERCSRYELAKAVCKVFGFDEGLVQPVEFAHVRDQFKAVRLKDSSFDVNKAQSHLQVKLMGVDEGLRHIQAALAVV